jgi:hypothetical protein
MPFKPYMQPEYARPEDCITLIARRWLASLFYISMRYPTACREALSLQPYIAGYHRSLKGLSIYSIINQHFGLRRSAPTERRFSTRYGCFCQKYSVIRHFQSSLNFISREDIIKVLRYSFQDVDGTGSRLEGFKAKAASNI